MIPVPSGGTPRRDKLTTLAVASGIAAMIIIYYGSFLHNFFDYDDFLYIENMYKGFLDILLGFNTFRIVSNLSWWPIFQLSGFDPLGYNLFSFGMLFIDALLFYFLCKALFKDVAVSALAALLFAGGSVGADALFWKCTNSTLICFFFYIISLLAYFRWRQGEKAALGVASLIAFALAILSKEESASLPGVIILVELLILGERCLMSIAKRITPFCAIIIFYILGSRQFFNLVGREPDPTKFFELRPLHTLLTPWSVFSLPPHGIFDLSDPFLYAIPTAVLAICFLIPNKKDLMFSFGWIFLTFLPQSFTSLGQFAPVLLFNSISRYMFLPSAGAALALALVLVGICSRWGRRVGVPVGMAVMAFYFSVHYGRVQERGRTWREDAEPVRMFLLKMKVVVPQFPPNSYVYVIAAPTGWFYLQQALRASYGNTGITWIVDPLKYRPKMGEYAFLVNCLWGNGTVILQVDDFGAGMVRLNAAR